MKLEKTLAYLESQLMAPSVQSDAYRSWLDDKSESLVTRYAWFAYNFGGGPKDKLTPLLEALEEVNRELEKVIIDRLEDYDARTYH